MNKIYKVIWNATLGTWVAVSEITKGKGKTKSGVKNIQKLSILPRNHQIFNKILYINILSFSISVVFSSSVLAGALDGGSVYLNCNPTDSNGSWTAGTAGQSVAIGAYACAPGDQALAIGANTYAKGNSSISIGGDDLNKVAGESNNTVAAQTYKKLTGDNLIANYDAKTGVGHQYINTESGNGAVALGVQSIAKGDLATAFGTRTNAQGIASVALGVGSYASKDGSVALGAGSTTATNASKVTEAKINGVNFLNFAGGTNFAGDASDTGRQVSVGNVGNERQIKNVAAGAISATSTDALNGSQVYAVTNTLIDQIQLTKSTSPIVYTDVLGNKVTKANDGKWYSSSFVDAGGNKIGSPTEVLASNISTRLQDANGSTKNSIELKNVKAGDLSAVSTDAVNGSQLFTTNKNVATNTTNITKNAGDITNLQNQTWKLQANGDGASAVKASDTVQFLNGTNVEIKRNGNDITIGSVAKPVYDSITVNNAPTDGTDVTNKTYVDGKVQTVTNTPLTFVGDDATVKVERKLGETLKVEGGATGTLTDGNIGVVADAASNKLTVKLAEDLKDLNSVTTGGTTANPEKTVLNKDGLTVTDGTSTTTIGADKITVGTGNKPVTIDGTTGTVNGLTNKTWTAGQAPVSGQAATEDQLKSVSDAQQATDDIAVKYNTKTDPNDPTKTIIDRDNVTFAGTTGGSVTKNADGSFTAMTGGTSLNNVASAGDITDVNNAYNAVNAGDLNNAVTNVTNKGLTFAGDTGKDVQRKLGETTKVVGGVTDPTQLSANNIGVVADGTDTLTVQLAKDLKDLNSITTGGTAANPEKTVLSKDGLTVTDSTGKISSTIGSDQITVGAGKNPVTINGTTGTVNGLTNKTWTAGQAPVSGQAATEDQLKSVSDAQQSTNDFAVKYNKDSTDPTKPDLNNVTFAGTTGGSVTKNADGSFTAMTGGTSLNNVASAGDITDVNNAYNAVNAGDLNNAVTDVTNKGLTFAGDTGKDVQRKLGETTKVVGGVTDPTQLSANNIGVVADGTDTLTVQLAKDLKDLNSITTGGTAANPEKTVLSKDGLTVTDSTGKISSTIGSDQITVGAGKNPVTINGTTGTVNGLTNKTWTAGQAPVSGQAATEDQLKSVSDAQQSTNDFAVKYNKDSTDPTKPDLNNVTFAGTTGGSVTKNADGSFTAMTGGTSLNNVASAGDITDVNNAYNAVNAGDLNNAVTDVTNKGLTFAGDTGKDVQRKLGETTKVVGGVTDPTQLSANNIGVVADGTDTLTVQLAKDLKDLNSITTGGTAANPEKTVLSKDGLTVTDSTGKISSTIGSDQITVGAGKNPVTINGTTGTVNGLTNKTWTAGQAPVSGQAATEDQLKSVSDAQQSTNDFAVKYNKDSTDPTKPDLNNVTFAGTTGGSVTKNADGSFTAMTGGTSLNNVASAGDITDVNNAYNAVNAGDLNNAVTDVTNKGLTFAGDTGKDVQRKLGETTKVVGGVTDPTQLSANNIGVVADGTDTLTVQLAKDLKDLNSITTGGTAANPEKTVLSKDGLTVTDSTGKISSTIGSDQITVGAGKNPVTINGTTGTVNGLTNKTWTAGQAPVSGQAATEDQLKSVSDAQQSTNDFAVKYNKDSTDPTKPDLNNVTFAGTTGGSVTKNADGSFTAMTGGTSLNNVASAGDITDVNNAYNAVNAGDLNNAVTDVTNKGLTFAGDTGKDVQRKLGETTKVVGGVTDPTQLSANNIGVVADGTDTLTVQLAKDLKDLNSITTGGTAANPEKTVLSKDGLTVTDSTGKISSTIGSDQITVGAGKNPVTINGTTGTVNGLTNKTWTAGQAPVSGQAATEDQLKSVSDAQQSTNDFAVKYNKDSTDPTKPDLNNVTFAGTTGGSVTKNADGSFTAMTGGTSLNNVASAGDITDVNNAYNAVNAGDLNNAVTDVTNKGLTFAGDTGKDVQRKLGETTKVVGGVTDPTQLSANNIGVVADGTDTLTVQLAKDLKDLNSITTGGTAANPEKTVLSKDGLTVTDSTGKISSTIGSDQITVGAGKNPVTINGTTGTVNGLTNKTWTAGQAPVSGQAATEDQLKSVSDAQQSTNDFAVKYNKDSTDPTKPDLNNVTFAGTTGGSVTKNADGSFTAMTGGTSLNNVASAGDITDVNNAYNAVNAGDLNNAVTDVTNKGLTFAGDTGKDVQRKLGETTKVVGGVTDPTQLSANNIGVVADGTDTLTVQLAKDLKDLNSITTGGTAANPEKTVLSKDGLTVTDSTGKISSTIGSDQITVGAGKNPVTINGTTGTVNGLTNKTWTAGQAPVSGQAATEDQLKSVSDAQQSTNDFAVKYNKDSTDPTKPDLNNVTFAGTTGGSVTKNADGSFTAMTGGTSLNNVASAGDITDVNNAYNAVNAGDLNNAVTDVTNKGLTFAGDTGKDVQRKLGETTKVVGGVTDPTQLSANNIGVVADGTDTLTVQLAKDLKDLNSITTGGTAANPEKTVLSKDGLTVTDSTGKISSTIGSDQITVGAGKNPVTINGTTGTVNGLTNKTWTAGQAPVSGQAATEDQLKSVSDAQQSTNDFAVKYNKDSTDPTKPDLNNVTFAGTTGGSVTKNADGSFTAMTGGTSLNNVASAGDITDVNNAYNAVNAGDLNNAVTNVTNKGLTFAGDTGKDVQRKLGETTKVVGGVTDPTQLSANNIGVVADGTDTLTVQLAKDLKDLNSITTGGTAANPEKTVLSKDGLTVTDSTGKISSTIGSDQITVGAGKNPVTINGTTGTVNGLTNKTWTAGQAPVSGQAATEDQLKSVSDAQQSTNDFAVKYNKDSTDPTKPDLNNVTFAGTTGGSVTKNADGSFTAMTGGTSLNNVASAGDITDVNNAYNAVNAGDLNNAVTNVTNKGLTFAGDTGKDVQRKLGETTKVVGGVTDPTQLSANNIGVVADGTDTLTVQLAKDLKDLNSITTGGTAANPEKTVLSKDGLTVTDSTGKISSTIGSDQITVGAGKNPVTINGTTGTVNGLTNKTWTAGQAPVSGQAATEDQLKSVSDAQQSTNDFAVKYNKDSTDPTKPDLNNVTFAGTTGGSVTKNADGSFTAMTGGTSLNNVASAGDITDVNNAYNAVNAGDLNNAVTDVTNKGLTFAGDTGKDVQRKLGETTKVVGGVTDPTQLSANNIGVVADGTDTLTVQLAKDLKDLNSITTGGTAANPEKTVLSKDGLTVTDSTGKISSTIGSDQITVGAGKNPVTINGTTGTVNGLTNKTWTAGQAPVSGQAATEDQLKSVSDAQQSTNDFAVKYNKDSTDPTKPDLNNVTFAGTTGGSVTKNADGSFTAMTGGTSLNNVASAGDITDVNNAYNAVNAGDLNNAVTDVTNKGLTFAGDTGKDVQRKLGETTKVVGGVTDPTQLSANNIGVVADGTDTLTVQLAKDLKDLNSITTGGTAANPEKTVLSKDGLTVTDSTGKISSTIGSDQITVGVGKNPVTINGTTGTVNGLTNKTWTAGQAPVSGQAATEDQLKSVSDAQQSTNDFAVKYNKDSTDPTKPDLNNVTFAGTTGGSVTKNADGSFTAMTGGTSLNNVASAGDITDVNNAYNAVNAGDLNNAVTDVTNKGLTFAGDTGKDVQRKLGETTKVVGGVTDPTQLSANNIGVVADGTDTLTVQLAKDLKDLNSITTGGTAANPEKTVLSKDGLTVTDSTGKISSTIGSDQITVGAGKNPVTINGTTGTVNGLTNKTWTAGQAPVSGQAATEDQLKSVSDAQQSTNDFAVKYNKDSTDPTKPDLNNVTFAGTTGGSVTKNADGSFTAMTGGTSLNNVASAGDITDVNNAYNAVNAGDLNNAVTDVTNKGLTFAGDTGKDVQRKLGETTKVVGGVTDPTQLSANNIGVVADGTDTLTVQLAKDLKDLNSITTGGTAANPEKTVLSKDGLTVMDSTGKISSTIGSDQITVGVGNKPVTIDGTTGTVNGLTNKDLKAADFATKGRAATEEQLSLAQDTTSTIIGGGVTNKAGSLTGPFTTNGSSYSNISEAIADQAKKSKTTVSEGDNITVTSKTNADGSTDYNVATKKDVNFDKVTVGNVVTDNKTNTITGVEAGSIGAGSKDVVNGGQIHDLVGKGAYVDNKGNVTDTVQNIGGTGANNIDDAIKNVNTTANKAKTTVTQGENITVTSGTNADGSSNYVVATAKDVKFDNIAVGPITISKDGVNAGNTQIKNLAAGTADGDAVNVSQLNKVVNQKIENDVTNIIGTSDGKTNALFETYNVSGQKTTDRRNILETVTSINTKGAKYFHTNAVDESVEAGVVGETNDSSAGGKNSTAIGVNAIVAAGATSTAALGHNTLATDEATNAVVVGSGSKVGGASTIAIGHNAQALGQQSISIGTGNIVTGNNSGALGDPSIVDGNSSYSVGNNNKVATDNTFVLGNDVTQTVDGSVVLGNKSAATTGAGVGGYTLAQATTADRDAITQTTSTTGAVAVGDATNGVYRQITGVAAGTADSDAVNVAQLKAVDHQVTTTQGALVDSLGGGSKVNQDGTITGPTYNVGGGTQTNVGDALDALNTKVNNVDTTANAGWTVKAGDQSQTIKPKATVEFVGDDNITVTQENDKEGNAKLAVELNKKLDVEQLKAGDTVINHGGVSIGQVVQLGGTGLIIQNGPSVTTTGINAGNKVISNVAAGQKDSDAVNKGQLDSAISNITNQVDQANNSSVQYDKKADGSVNKDSVTLGGGSNGTTLTNVAEGKVQEGSKDAVNGGQLWSVEQKVNQNTSDINNIKNEINNGSLGLVQQTGGSKADITVGKNTGGTTVNMAGKDGDRIVTGVADGAVNKDSKDAINGSQLHAQKVETNQKVVEYLGGGAAIDNITGSFTTAPSYTVGDSKYNNVGGAIDALNKADQELGNKINNVSNRLEQAFQSTNQRIDDVEKRANAGIAAAMALENAPYIPGKYTYAAGASYHGGESAIGVTLRKTADNGRWSLTGGIAAASEGDPSVRIGISGVID
ncbi:ESPR-type extended signal peptide-containing protein [Acinetobacter piscicola]|uniref:ESPR-type extended signal peptide-containing protein n=1 Tax=Acinetobacter piscicola TaxID=2006115 RepID=UPI003556DD53